MHIEPAFSLAAGPKFMSDPQQTDAAKLEFYRTRAEDCERMAAETGDPDSKRWFLRAAKEWRFLHDQLLADLRAREA
jgi:hypothetical protein